MIRRSLVLLRLALVAACAAVAILVAGCGGGAESGEGSGGANGTSESPASTPAKPGGVIRVAQLAEPTTLNPSAMVETPSVEVSAQISEPLYKQNEAGEVVPLLATGYKRSKDGLTWTFGIRKGVKFSNGRPMTADDVAFSLEAARKSAIWAGLWEAVESVKVLSPTSVQVKTKQPMAAMLPDLTSYSAAIVPDNYGGVSEKQFAQHPIGTGPFELKSWAHGSAITLVKNPHYWQHGQPIADEVVFLDVPDDNSRISQMKGGELDLIGQPALSQMSSFETTPGFTVGNYGMFEIDVLSLNLGKPQFKDKRVREAVNLAIDREGIVKAALDGFGEPAGSFLPPTLKYSDPNLKAPQRDIAKAKALLAEAVKEGFDPSFTITTLAGQAYAGVASQIIQQNLDEVGFKVKLQPLDEAALVEEWLTGQTTASLGAYYAGVPDASELTGFYLGSIAKPNGVETKPYEAIATEAAGELDSAGRGKLYEKLQEMVADESQLIAIDYQPAIWVMPEQVTGLEVNSINTIFLNKTGFTG